MVHGTPVGHAGGRRSGDGTFAEVAREAERARGAEAEESGRNGRGGAKPHGREEEEGGGREESRGRGIGACVGGVGGASARIGKAFSFCFIDCVLRTAEERGGYYYPISFFSLSLCPGDGDFFFLFVLLEKYTLQGTFVISFVHVVFTYLDHR